MRVKNVRTLLPKCFRLSQYQNGHENGLIFTWNCDKMNLKLPNIHLKGTMWAILHWFGSILGIFRRLFWTLHIFENFFTLYSPFGPFQNHFLTFYTFFKLPKIVLKMNQNDAKWPTVPRSAWNIGKMDLRMTKSDSEKDQIGQKGF